MNRNLKYVALLLCTAVLVGSCVKERWDESKEAGGNIGISLLEVIAGEPECSAFYETLLLTGYDKTLADANNYTVFVPANSAWEALRQSIDSTAQAQGYTGAAKDSLVVLRLKTQVANHIMYEKHLLADPDSGLFKPLVTVGGKTVRYNAALQLFNGAKLTSIDRVAANGVFYLTDRNLEWRSNIWDYISTLNTRTYRQVAFLRGKSINYREMDMEKSVFLSYDPLTSQPIYDTVWIDRNEFLAETPLNDETQLYTYLIVQNGNTSTKGSYYNLQEKFTPYMRQNKTPALSATDATAKFTEMNICRDLTIAGLVDVKPDQLLKNIDGVSISLADATVSAPIELSNGRVYIVNKCNILLRDKIKAVRIEGENFTGAEVPGNVFTRDKKWASGGKDMMLANYITQNGRTFYAVSGWNGTGQRPNAYVEYKAQVYSAPYEIYYVAYDDIASHYADSAHTLVLRQKLFVAMPGKTLEKKALGEFTNGYSAYCVKNNYMFYTVTQGAQVVYNDTCFVALDTAGVYKERKMQKYIVTSDVRAQTLIEMSKFDEFDRPYTVYEPARCAAPYTMSVSNAGEIMMWLCNTATNSEQTSISSPQGILFLDYMELRPVLPPEE